MIRIGYRFGQRCSVNLKFPGNSQNGNLKFQKKRFLSNEQRPPPKKKNSDKREPIIPIILVIGGIFLAKNILSRDSRGPPVVISWKEFQYKLLPTGEIDLISIEKDKTANVRLKNPISLSDTNLPSNVKMSLESEINEKNDFVDPWENEKSETTFEDRRNYVKHLPKTDHYKFDFGSIESFEKKLEEAQKELGLKRDDFINVIYETPPKYENMIEFLTPLAVILIVSQLISLRMSGSKNSGGFGNVFKMLNPQMKKNRKENINVSFKDVAGVDEAKKEIMEFVEFLKNPKKFTDLGAKIPRGAMLSGPPGTGKTLLARATAGEASVPFFSISGSEFIEMYAGVGASRVRELFKEARSNAPCIVFIDEIDAVGRKRIGRQGGANEERESTLNQLLVEMDGFNERTNIVVLAGTNRADVLDPALLRPGRFDRQITVDLPDIRGRKQIFGVHLKGLKLDEDPMKYSGRLAGLTPGFSGADIENICNEAAIVAARNNLKQVDFKCFEQATDRVIGGLESKKLISPEEKNIVSHHEAGHAVIGWNLEHADPLLKVTIVPRGKGSLGYAQYLPKEVSLRTKAQINDIICMALAGRASEEAVFGKCTNGASDDLRRVTQIVYQLIATYGMSEKIGHMAFPQDDNFLGKSYSNYTAELMDSEAKEMVENAYKRTLGLVHKHMEQIKAVAGLLLERETINHDDIKAILGERPFPSDKAYQDFITSSMESEPAKEGGEMEGEEEEKKGEEAEEKKGEEPTPAFGWV